MLAANRDEFRDRPADGPGEIAPGVFAGRDRLAGGTWLAVAATGLAAITNVSGTPRRGDAPSRGSLPLAALAGALPTDPTRWNGFNLLVVDRTGARILTNAGDGRIAGPTPLGPGLHVVVNEPWGLTRTARALRAREVATAAGVGFDALADHGAAGDDGLCHHGDAYGTVSSTVIALDRDLRVVRYLHRPGLPCRTPGVDLTDAARAVTARRV